MSASKTKKTGNIEVLFVGRLEPRKGIDVLLKAIPPVAKSRPDVAFKIVGDDCVFEDSQITYRQKFHSENERADYLDRVTFTGRLDEDVLREAYASCDIFVAPSRFESFGLVFLEAMREAKPVIGCRAGGVPEIVEHGVTGLLVLPDDPAALAVAIVTLASQSNLRRSMGQEGQRRFHEKFNAQRMAIDSIALYDLAKLRYELPRAS